MTTPRYGTLFHFTHIDNIEEILGQGVLRADSEVERLGLLRTEAGHQGIKERRRHQPVTCWPGGVVADYVPFYFAARSPMMLTLKSGNVPSFTGSHTDLVYLVSDVWSAHATGQPCVVSDRNAAVGVAEFSDDLAVLGDLSTATPDNDFVDWPLMNETIWKPIPEYPDRMERRMAEFLVHEYFPLEALTEVGVHDEGVGSIVERMFVRAGLRIPITTPPGWYYS